MLGFRRVSFLVTRLLANLCSSGATQLLSHFSTPVGEAAGLIDRSMIKNSDFRIDTDGDGLADHWQFQSDCDQANFAREKITFDSDQWSQRVTCEKLGEKERASVMLSQNDVPVEEGQWYQISFRARSKGLRGLRVNMTLTDTSNWKPLFEYQSFRPDEQWKQYTFQVQSNGTARSQTRFQLWYGSIGTVWFSEMRMEPCEPPWKGRWLTGLYLDKPVEMDDPYRFFRW